MKAKFDGMSLEELVDAFDSRLSRVEAALDLMFPHTRAEIAASLYLAARHWVDTRGA